MTDSTIVEKRECHHRENHSRTLTLKHENIRYDIASCDVCADVALKSDGSFTEVSALH